MTLKEFFPVLFECASNKEATISEVLVRENGRVDWNVTFVRNFNNWELDDVVSFLHLLHSNFPFWEVDDGLRWNLRKNGIFDVHSFYDALQDSPNVASLGGVFGEPKLLVGFVSLSGRRLGIGF
jgi:hypothetical protein